MSFKFNLYKMNSIIECLENKKTAYKLISMDNSKTLAIYNCLKFLKSLNLSFVLVCKTHVMVTVLAYDFNTRVK